MTTAHPTISAVIPAYQAEGHVARAIESVLSQTRPVLEVIVVDDGSRDATSTVVEQFGSPVRLIRQDNAGPNAARNHGVRESRGDWCALLDADDAWLPTKLERQAAYMANERVGLVDCLVVGASSKYRFEGQLTFDALWRQNMIGTSTVVVRRATWEALGGFDEDRLLMGAEDYNSWLRVLLAGWDIARCDERLSEYTPAENNVSSQISGVMRAELLNAERIAWAAGIPAAVLQEKFAAIYSEYGQAMLHARDLKQARRCLAQVMLRRPTAAALTHWLATFVPPAVLDWRRSPSPIRS